MKFYCPAFKGSHSMLEIGTNVLLSSDGIIYLYKALFILFIFFKSLIQDLLIWVQETGNLLVFQICFFFFRYRAWILILTFLVYTCYHMSKKPVSVVKVICLYCYGNSIHLKILMCHL